MRSYWMKSQSGSYSDDRNDSFNPEKRYTGIRLQQAVLPLDRDWNELEDIRRYEEVMLRKWYIGNGTSDDGFKITPAGTSNDFNISPGRCLVEGFEAVNDSPIPYSGQKDLPALSVPSGQRSDTIYIDLWIREISGSEDPTLLNPQDLGRETCRRHKVEWRVRVDEGRGEGDTGHSPEEEFHHYYDIARIDRDGSQVAISDLRRTGLSVYLLRDRLATLEGLLTALSDLGNSVSTLKDELTKGKVADGLHSHSKLVGSGGSPDPVVYVDGSGNIGIGTSNPISKLQVSGDLVLGKTEGPARSLPEGAAMIWNDGTWLRLGQNLDAAVTSKVRVPGLFAPSSVNIGKSGGDYLDPGEGNVSIAGRVMFNGLQSRMIYGDKLSGQDALILRGNWDELDVKGRVIDWTGSNLHIGYENNHLKDAIYLGSNKCILNRVEINHAAQIGVKAGNEVGLKLNSADGGGVIYARDLNHSIFFRIGRDGSFDVTDYHQVGIHRFFTGGLLELQGIRIIISDVGVDIFDNLRVRKDISYLGNLTKSSDMRLKSNIIPLANMLERLEKIRGVSFKWLEGTKMPGCSSEENDIGLIAQEIEPIFPEMVSKPDDAGYLGIDYTKFIAVLIEAIKELKAELEVFKRKTIESDRKIEKLEKATRI